jgi:hypothetical protein
MKRVLRVFCVSILVLALTLVALWAVLTRSDGPTGPIPGGELTSGLLVEEAQIDWSAVLGDQAVAEIELQLVEPPGSRTTGAFVFGGHLYVPVDLGYVWRRVPDATTRRVLHLIWLLKRWHEDVIADGRVVIRIDGRRYERTAARVTDPILLERFRARVSDAAAEFMGGLSPVETDPADIWFFRMDPRVGDSERARSRDKS